MNPRPVFVSLGLEPSAFPPEFGGFTDPAQSPFSQPKGCFDCAATRAGTVQHRYESDLVLPPRRQLLQLRGERRRRR